MTHYRTAIADAFKAVLIDKTEANDRVHTKMARPINPMTETPALCIYCSQAKRGPVDMGNSVVPRIVIVTIEGAVSSSADRALDAADEMADAIEEVLEKHQTIGNLVENVRWMRTITDANMMGQTTVGVCLLEYEVCLLTENRQADPFGEDLGGIPKIVHTLPDNTGAELFPPGRPADDGPACGVGGCAPEAWGGEVFPDGSPIL